jgi:hypothetical protein
MSLDSIELLKEVETPGIIEFPEPTGKIAYGFQIDYATGAFNVVRLDGDSDFVKLPDDNIISNDDYAQVVWSNKLLNFSWPTTAGVYPGHLQVEIV